MDTPTSQPYTPTPAPAPMTPPVTPVPAPVSSGPRSNKGIIAAVVVAVLLIGGYLAWAMTADSWPFAPSEPVATPTPSPSPTATPDPTAGWQTYTNAEFGFEVKYPSDWSVVLNSQTGAALLLEKSRGEGNESDRIFFTQWENQGSEEQNLAYLRNTFDSKTIGSPIAEQNWNGFYSNKPSAGGGNRFAFIYDEDHIFAIEGFIVGDWDPLLQILSTFKFTP